MQKNIFFFSIFFSYYLPTGTSFSVKKSNFWLKFCVKILFCRHCFSPFNTFMRKGKEPEPDPDPFLWLIKLYWSKIDWPWGEGAEWSPLIWGDHHLPLDPGYTHSWCLILYPTLRWYPLKKKPRFIVNFLLSCVMKKNCKNPRPTGCKNKERKKDLAEIKTN